MPAIRVLLVDDHPVVRLGMRNILALADGIEVIGEASNGEEGLQMVRELHPDVLVLDLEMPGMSGVEVARELQSQSAAVHVLALSGHKDGQYIRGLLESGASGYLVKDEAQAELVEAVRGVARGEQGWLSRQIKVHMIALMQTDHQQPAGLTNREMQVLQEVVAGKTNQEIGLALGISEKTVEKHLESVYQKLDVSSRTEAAVWAARDEMNQG